MAYRLLKRAVYLLRLSDSLQAPASHSLFRLVPRMKFQTPLSFLCLRRKETFLNRPLPLPAWRLLLIPLCGNWRRIFVHWPCVPRDVRCWSAS